MFSLSKFPATALGWTALGGAMFGCGLGWWFGWIEFMIIGIGCLLALAMAVPFVLGTQELHLERSIVPVRVAVGSAARSELAISNPGPNSCATRTIVDQIGHRTRTIDIPALGAGETMHHRELLPTERRGVFSIGPARLTKVDPLTLFRRDFGESEVVDLVVHPDHRLLVPLRSGFAKDLEGPTFDTAPAGDVAFHTLREYQPGDDVRQVHWLSTARAGQLMVRHNVDNRLPFLGVVVDRRTGIINEDEFELLLGAATSLLISARADDRPVAVWVGEDQIATAQRPASTDEALDRLAAVSQHDDDRSPRQIQSLATLIDPNISAIVFITNARDIAGLIEAVTYARRSAEVIIVQARDERADTVAIQGALTVPFRDLDELEAQWAAAAT